jgi:hypothetical protein
MERQWEQLRIHRFCISNQTLTPDPQGARTKNERIRHLQPPSGPPQDIARPAGQRRAWIAPAALQQLVRGQGLWARLAGLVLA